MSRLKTIATSGVRLGVAGEREPADEVAEGGGLVLVSVEHEPRTAFMCVQEGMPVVDRGAQRERVDAVTDEIAVLDLGLPGERDADHDVRLPREPGDEDLEGREESDVSVEPWRAPSFLSSPWNSARREAVSWPPR